MSPKVASPLTAATVNVPDSVPPPGLPLIASVILSDAVVRKLPKASWTWTLMAGEVATVETALVGSTAKTTCVAVPAAMSKSADTAVLNPIAHEARL